MPFSASTHTKTIKKIWAQNSTTEGKPKRARNSQELKTQATRNGTWGKRGGAKTYEEVGEVDEGPSHAGGEAEDREGEKPGEEEDEYVCGPHEGISEPLRVPVKIRRQRRLHVHLRIPFPLPFETGKIE